MKAIWWLKLHIVHGFIFSKMHLCAGLLGLQSWKLLSVWLHKIRQKICTCYSLMKVMSLLTSDNTLKKYQSPYVTFLRVVWVFDYGMVMLSVWGDFKKYIYSRLVSLKEFYLESPSTKINISWSVKGGHQTNNCSFSRAVIVSNIF